MSKLKQIFGGITSLSGGFIINWAYPSSYHPCRNKYHVQHIYLDPLHCHFVASKFSERKEKILVKFVYLELRAEYL